MMEKIRWIWNVWKPLRIWFVALLLFTAFSTIVALGYPLVLRSVIDALEEIVKNGEDRSEDRIRSLLGMLFLLAITRFLATYYPALRAYLNNLIEKQVRETYFGHILRKGERFFQAFRTGDLVTRLTDDISEYPRIAWFCCSGIFRAVESGSKFFFCLWVMIYLDWKLALISVLPLPLMMAIFVMIKRKLREYIEAQRKEMSETNDLLEASFSGVRIIKAHNGEHRQADALAAQLKRRLEVEMNVVKLWQLIHGFYNSLGVLGQVVVVAFGGVLVIRGELSSGTFYAFYVYLGMLVAPLLDLPNLFVTGRQAFVSIDREEEIRLTDQEGEGGVFRGKKTLGRFEALSLNSVPFDYPTRRLESDSEEDKDTKPSTSETKTVLENIDLSLSRGERIALIGRLGTGKSTLLQLAAGAMAAKSGVIEWNGKKVEEYSASGLKPNIGYVSQQAKLFTETIKNNILFGREEDLKLLEDVVEAVGLKEEIAGFEKGLEEMLGHDGLSLSGGQRQRVAIARAIYGRPQVLFLDDLTSALDAENEARLWKRLEKLIPESTLLVVTHRMATARVMDRICLLDENTLVARGTHHELMENSALYQEFQHEFIPESPESVTAK
ncbi:MAG: ABC transporter ATP-binding protein [Planctomycetota bacterium]|nr:ABC transporter ATP-binding protein [Planctomycetota bacterium]